MDKIIKKVIFKTTPKLILRFPKPIAKPRKVIPLMKVIWGLPPELQEKIYKATIESTPKERKKRGWNKIHQEIINFHSFLCKDIFTKALVFDNILLCLVCFCNGVVHSFGDWPEYREIYLLGYEIGNLEKWVGKKYNKSLSELTPQNFEEWYKKNGVLLNPFGEPHLREEIKKSPIYESFVTQGA